jgi:hypothetical protein
MEEKRRWVSAAAAFLGLDGIFEDGLHILRVCNGM